MKFEDSYHNGSLVKAKISSEEKEQAKALAKSKGMTFQGWLGQLIKNALKEEREATDEQ